MYHLLNGSPLEPFLTQLILTMVDSLVPLEILDQKTYNDFYIENIAPTVRIRNGSTTSTLADAYGYKTSNVKIWSQMCFMLFASILGARRTTRYQHVLAFCSEYFYHQSQRLKTTPRSLYGSDAGEHFNDKIKNLLYSITNKFGGRSKQHQKTQFIPKETLDLLLKYCWWEHLMAREKNKKLSTNTTQKRIREQQRLRDEKNIDASACIRYYLKQNNVTYQLKNKIFDSTQENVIAPYELENEKEDLEEKKVGGEQTEDIIFIYQRILDNLNSLISMSRDEYGADLISSDIEYEGNDDSDVEYFESIIQKYENLKCVGYFDESNVIIRHLCLKVSSGFVALGVYELYMRFGFECRPTKFEDFRISTKWCNISQISFRQIRNYLCLYVKFASALTVKQYNKIKKKKKKATDPTEYRYAWVEIAESLYPESVKVISLFYF